MNEYIYGILVLLGGVVALKWYKLVKLRRIKARLLSNPAVNIGKNKEKSITPLSPEILKPVNDIHLIERKDVSFAPTAISKGGVIKKDFIKRPSIKKEGGVIYVTIPDSIQPTTLKANSGFISDLLVKSGHLSKDFLIENDPNPRTLKFISLPPRNPLLDGKGIDGNVSEYIEEINNLKENEVFVGNVYSSHDLEREGRAIINLKTAPHFVVIGTTRSGKSKSLAGLITSMAVSKYNKNAIFLFGCGKGSGDYDQLADKVSPFPVAKPSQTEDPWCEFANIIEYFYSIYIERRDVLFPQYYEEIGMKVSTYSEIEEIKRKTDPSFTIPRVVLAMDEWKAFNDLLSDKEAVNSAKKDGGLIDKIGTILRAGASYKMTVALASQEYKAETFPPTFKSQLSTLLCHSFANKADYEYVGIPADRVAGLKAGGYVLRSPGLFCAISKDGDISSRLPYVGDNPEIYKTLPEYKGEKRKFDKNIIYPDGSESKGLEKMSKKRMSHIIKTAIFIREGWEITEVKDSEHLFIPYSIKKGEKEYGVGFVNKSEANDPDVLERINTYQPDFIKLPKIFFVMSSGVGKEKEGWLRCIGGMGDIVLSFEDYQRLFFMAKDLYTAGDNTPIFTSAILGSKDRKREEEKARIEADLGKGIELTIKEFKRIANMPGKSQKAAECKGLEFERFIHTLYRALGWSTFTMEHLLDGPEGWYERSSRSGDKGWDGLFFPPEVGPVTDLRKLTPEQSKARVGVQMKNYARGITGEGQGAVISRTYSGAANYPCLVTGEKATSFIVFQVADNWTSGGRDEARNMNTELVGGREIISLIKSLDSKIEQKPVIDIDKKAEVLKLKQEGMTNADISKKLGITRQYVSKILKEAA